MRRFFSLLTAFFISLPAILVGQYPTDQPRPDNKELEHVPTFWAEYGDWIIGAIIVLFVILVIGYILRWDKKK